MAGRWSDPSAFRPDPAAAPAAQPSRRQTQAVLIVLLLVAGAVAAASYLVRPERARAFDLFHGSVFLADEKSPVAIDLASGKPTLRLLGAETQVAATGTDTLGVVPLNLGTLLLNQSTGEFNLVDNSGFVVKHNGGVPLARRRGPTTAFGVAARDGQAYVVRTGAVGGTDVYLVGQATVEAAINATKGVRPRASTTLPPLVSTAAGGSASANGDLWTLAATSVAGHNALDELSVPAGSSAGARLDVRQRVAVAGPAAIGTATTSPSSDVVAVASADRIQLFAPGTGAHTTTFAAPAGVDEVLSATGDQHRLAFLMHAAAGWNLVSIGADGTGFRPPRPVVGLPADAQPAPPVVSNGRLYLIDHRDGAIYQLGYDGRAGPVPGAASYPLSSVDGRVIERTDFGDAYALARGARVVFDSAVHAQALMVFTDGSRAPLRITKGTAVTVNASGGPEALTRSTANPNQPPAKRAQPGQPKPKSQPAPINNKIDCRTAKQKPHIPVITSSVPGSRSVALAWNYPVLDSQDCYPSTYVVTARLISNDAPQPPAPARVQSQTGTDLTGLFPSTQYDITVTAYINGLGTDSVSRRITTGAEGPAAPSDLAVSADDTGNWSVRWSSCGGVGQGCVPAESWTITPSFCDGRGLSAPPAAMTVTADPTSRVQAPAVYPGSDDLLGRGLRFQVQGVGDQGQVGTPSASSACVYSWSMPVTADLTVAASSPPPTSSSTDTTSTTATVTFANGQVHDLGGAGGTLTYQLLSGGSVLSTRGPTSDPSVALAGIRPGRLYQVRVQASPPRHPEIVVDVATVDVAPAVAQWPAIVLRPPSFDSPPGATGTLHIGFAFPAGTDAGGETFDLTDSQLVCGNTALPLTDTDVAPGDVMTFPVDRGIYNGGCTVTVQLAQDPRTSTNPPLYGAGSSRAVTSDPVSIPPPSLTTSAGDFDAAWGGSADHSTVVVTYHGGDDLSGASDWRMTVSNGSTTCGAETGDPPPVTIDVDNGCVRAGSSDTVTIDYRYFGVADAHFVVSIGGTIPTPVDPTKISFSAAWNDDPKLPQVDVTYTGSEPASALSPLAWTETVTSSGSPGVACTATDDGNPGESSVRIDVDLTACPPTVDGAASVYTVHISFTDPNYRQTGEYRYPVTGPPPL